MNITEQQAFEKIQEKIEAMRDSRKTPLRVAINGVEGTGKTTFAEKFVKYLQENNLPAEHISIDGFHFNKETRYRQGRDSARGYYEDSYDEKGFAEKVLEQSQSGSYIPATHDLESDKYLILDPVEIALDIIIIVDGSYLFKPVYEPHFDLKIYLKTDFDTARSRGAKRDAGHLGGEEAAARKFLARYHAASQMYIDEVNPESLADIVIDNTDFENLVLVRF